MAMMTIACDNCGRLHDKKPSQIKRNKHQFCSLERIWIEIAKCDVRCVNCHRIKTSKTVLQHQKVIGSATYKRNSEKYAERDRIKTSRGCADCGYNENPVALDFDHVRGVKLKPVSQMMSHGLEDILREIDKCDVVCANCHRIRTYNRRQLLVAG